MTAEPLTADELDSLLGAMEQLREAGRDEEADRLAELAADPEKIRAVLADAGEGADAGDAADGGDAADEPEDAP